MTRLLLDTSAFSGFLRGRPELKLALQQAREIYVNPVVLGELLAGFRRGKRPGENRRQLAAFLASPRVQVLDIRQSTAERYAAILDHLWTQGSPIPTNDIWIAASAMEHGLALLTSDAHFLKVPQVLLDYHPLAGSSTQRPVK